MGVTNFDDSPPQLDEPIASLLGFRTRLLSRHGPRGRGGKVSSRRTRRATILAHVAAALSFLPGRLGTGDPRTYQHTALIGGIWVVGNKTGTW